MASYCTPAGVTVSINPASEQAFYGALAMLSQYLIEIEDRACAAGFRDQDDRRNIMADAIDEWSAAVRHGFVCC